MERMYEEKIQADVNAIFTLMAKRVDEKQLALIRAAYEFARKAHEGQYRKSGEPYISHPVAVALIVANELGLGANTVIAALCHDIAEDTDYTIEDIRERFDDDVAFLVGVVTKQKKEKYDKSKQVDNYRQILSSVQYDVRAILVKLADSIVAVDFKENEQFLFPVRINIRGIDRHHLLSDVVACITEQQNLSITKLVTETKDRIVETTVNFKVHSAAELQQAIDNIRQIISVDEVARLDIE